MASTNTKSGLTASRLREVLDYDPVTGIFRWRISPTAKMKAGSIAGALEVWGYWRISIDWQPYKAHRLAWLYVYGVWPPGELDHKDLVKHHNWIDNLRPATQTQNNANRNLYRNNKTGFKGVYKHKDQYRAMIRHNRKGLHLGCFNTPEEAHAAYVAKAKELFGEFANDGF